MKVLSLILLIVTLAAAGTYSYSRSPLAVHSPSPGPSLDNRLLSSRVTCTPTFQDGGGPYYQPDAPMRDSLAPVGHKGEELTVTGRVLQSDCVTPLTHVVVDVWQANESGNYDDEWYRGRVETNDNGEYSITTVVPKGYGSGSGFRPPHIHFKIWQGDTLLITSQMFLPESKNQGIEDAYIMRVESQEKKGVISHRGFHNIILPAN